MIAALMLGRKGSKGFPGKNHVPVLGRPMLLYPLLAAKHARGVDKVFVSTDDEKIMEIARDQGAQIIVRPPELASATALGEDAYVHGYKTIRKNHDIELIVLLFCNAPTILSKTIDEGIQVLRSRPELDSAVTVSAYNMWSPLRARRVTPEGTLAPFVPLETFGDPRTMNCDRDSQGDVFFADMSVSIVRPRCLEDISKGLLPQKWMGQKIYPIRQWGGLDVDFEWQIPQAEFWLRKNSFTETRTPYDVTASSRKVTAGKDVES